MLFALVNFDLVEVIIVAIFVEGHLCLLFFFRLTNLIATWTWSVKVIAYRCLESLAILFQTDSMKKSLVFELVSARTEKFFVARFEALNAQLKWLLFLLLFL